MTPVSAAGEVDIGVNSSGEVKQGNYTVCTIEFGKVTDLNAAQFDIKFDPAILGLESIKNGKTSTGTNIPVMSNQIGPGHYRVITSFGLNSISGEGYLAAVSFYALKGGSTAISLSGGILSSMQGGAIPAVWTGDSITVIPAVTGGGEIPSSAPSSQDGVPEGTGTNDATGGETPADEGSDGQTAADGDAGSGEETPVAETGAETGEDSVVSENVDGNGDDDDQVHITITGSDGSEETEETGEIVKTVSAGENGGKRVKWEVLWGIIAGAAVIIGLAVFAQLRKT